MKRYLVILIAILAGLITLALINKLSRDTSEGGGVTKGHIVAGLVSFITLAIGLFLLEIGAAPPSSVYVPATLVDGQVVEPEFIAPKEER